jgi:hypothetical protein
MILGNTPKAFGVLFGSLPKSFFARQRAFPTKPPSASCRRLQVRHRESVLWRTSSLRSPEPRAHTIRNYLAEATTKAHGKLQFRYSSAAQLLL